MFDPRLAKKGVVGILVFWSALWEAMEFWGAASRRIAVVRMGFEGWEHYFGGFQGSCLCLWLGFGCFRLALMLALAFASDVFDFDSRSFSSLDG